MKKNEVMEYISRRVAEIAGFKVENKDNGKCINCNGNGLENCYSVEGKREFAISGLCEICFDDITANVGD